MVCVSGANERVLDAIASVVPPRDLPCLLWWVGVTRHEALQKLEQLGCELGDAMGSDGDDFDDALERWIVALCVALKKFNAAGESFGARPIWCFWALFTRDGEPASALSQLLEDAVGLPTDEEAGISMAGGGERDV